MSQQHDGLHSKPEQGDDEDLEQLLLQGVHLEQEEAPSAGVAPSSMQIENDEDTEISHGSDLQGALGLFAEASQDMATASVELGLGRHFACVDFCNQAVEKAAQSISLFRFGHRSRYDHDLRALGAFVGAPAEIQDEMARLTPFHPETFYADTPPEEADEVINAEMASSYVQSARRVLRWAKEIVLNA